MRKIMRKTAIVSVLLLLAAFMLNAESADPEKLIKTKIQKLQSILRQKGKTGNQEKREKIKKLVSEMFDFQEMGRKSLSKTTYDSLPEEQRERFVKAFQEMIENTSIRKLELYKSDSTIYDAPVYRKDDKEANVTAHTYFEGQESIVVYKMFLRNGQWRGWDLVIDDLHTTRNYKTIFIKILKTKTFEELIKLLEDKAKNTEKEEKAEPKKQ